MVSRQERGLGDMKALFGSKRAKTKLPVKNAAAKFSAVNAGLVSPPSFNVTADATSTFPVFDDSQTTGQAAQSTWPALETYQDTKHSSRAASPTATALNTDAPPTCPSTAETAATFLLKGSSCASPSIDVGEEEPAEQFPWPYCDKDDSYDCTLVEQLVEQSLGEPGTGACNAASVEASVVWQQWGMQVEDRRAIMAGGWAPTQAAVATLQPPSRIIPAQGSLCVQLPCTCPCTALGIGPLVMLYWWFEVGNVISLWACPGAALTAMYSNLLAQSRSLGTHFLVMNGREYLDAEPIPRIPAAAEQPSDIPNEASRAAELYQELMATQV